MSGTTESAERTATLEISFDGGSRGAVMALDRPAPDDLAYVIHAREVIADHLDPLPLCWVAEAKQRLTEGENEVELWEVSFDHEALPNFAVIDVRAFVTCPECKEWIHA